MGAWPPGIAAVRGGRLLEEPSGLRDLATGLPATFAIRLLTETAAAWRGPVPGTSRGQSGSWVVDAWLGLDPLGRWLERVIVVSGVKGERQQRRDRCLLAWLTEA